MSETYEKNGRYYLRATREEKIKLREAYAKHRLRKSKLRTEIVASEPKSAPDVVSTREATHTEISEDEIEVPF